MTTAQAVTYFQVLIDKYGSPSVITSEVYTYLNHAINEYVNRLLPDTEGGIENWEQDENVMMNLQPLIFNLSLTPSSGLITVSNINTALTTAASEVGAEYLRIGSIGKGTLPIRFVRQNNFWAFQRNFFKRPSSTKLRYTVAANGLQIYPTTTTGPILLNVIKKPRIVSGSVDPEFGDYQMYGVISLAAQLCGVSVRDSELIETLKGVTLQNTK